MWARPAQPPGWQACQDGVTNWGRVQVCGPHRYFDVGEFWLVYVFVNALNIPMIWRSPDIILFDQVYWPARVAGKLLLFRLQLWDAGDAAVRKYGHVYPVCRWLICQIWNIGLTQLKWGEHFKGRGIWGATGVFLQRQGIVGGTAWLDSEDCHAGVNLKKLVKSILIRIRACCQ